MKKINADTTALNAVGVTPELLLSGEGIELNPEKKVDRRGQYVQYEFAANLVNALTTDLRNAYRAIEELESDNEGLAAQLADAKDESAANAEQVRRVLAGEASLSEAEKLLATFEQQLETLAAGKKDDEALIADLKAEVNELVALREEVPQLRADVDQVLKNLQSYFEEEGLDMYPQGYSDDLS